MLSLPLLDFLSQDKFSFLYQYFTDGSQKIHEIPPGESNNSNVAITTVSSASVVTFYSVSTPIMSSQPDMSCEHNLGASDKLSRKRDEHSGSVSSQEFTVQCFVEVI